MRSFWCYVFWGLIWSQLYTSCLTIPPATECNIAQQETLQPKNTHLSLCPGNVYPVHEHEKQKRKPTRTPTPTPTPTLKTFKLCKQSHAIFYISPIFATPQDGFDQRQRGFGPLGPTLDDNVPASAHDDVCLATTTTAHQTPPFSHLDMPRPHLASPQPPHLSPPPLLPTQALKCARPEPPPPTSSPPQDATRADGASAEPPEAHDTERETKKQ
jgi:hypothetical protein